MLPALASARHVKILNSGCCPTILSPENTMRTDLSCLRPKFSCFDHFGAASTNCGLVLGNSASSGVLSNVGADEWLQRRASTWAAAINQILLRRELSPLGNNSMPSTSRPATARGN